MPSPALLPKLILALALSLPTLATAADKNPGRKIGLTLGSNAINAAIDRVDDIGSWYYTYGPYPDRQGRNRTRSMAFRSGKEFVPMIAGRGFWLDDSYKRQCVFDKRFVVKGRPLCGSKVIETALAGVMRDFRGHPRPPQYLMLQNEPWNRKPGRDNPYKGHNVSVTPAQAVQTMRLAQGPARRLGLKLVSPTVDRKMSWFSDFLRQCAADQTCDVTRIAVFSVHKYQCDRKSWRTEFARDGFRKQLLRKVPAQSVGMSAAQWRAFVYSRPIWVTETSCSYDDDYAAAERKPNPKYPLRTNVDSCLRASGTDPDPKYGLLPEVLAMGDDKIARIAWWTTYVSLNKVGGSVFAANPGTPLDRARAVRLFDESGKRLTPIGRAIRQAYRDPAQLDTVECSAR